MKAQHPGLATGLVFSNARGGLYRGSPLRPVLDAACEAAKLGRRVTPHGLRHTANDLLRRVASGEVVRAIVGHSTTAMTTHYSHVDEGEKRSAAGRALAIVRGPQTGDQTGDGALPRPTAGRPENDDPRSDAGLEGGAARI